MAADAYPSRSVATATMTAKMEPTNRIAARHHHVSLITFFLDTFRPFSAFNDDIWSVFASFSTCWNMQSDGFSGYPAFVTLKFRLNIVISMRISCDNMKMKFLKLPYKWNSWFHESWNYPYGYCYTNRWIIKRRKKMRRQHCRMRTDFNATR